MTGIGRFLARLTVRRLLALLLAGVLALPGASSAATAPADPTLVALVGQKLMVAMSGTAPDADLLGRIGRGEVGGVILFGANITTARALRTLTATLQGAAAAGSQLPLLIATEPVKVLAVDKVVVPEPA